MSSIYLNQDPRNNGALATLVLVIMGTLAIAGIAVSVVFATTILSSHSGEQNGSGTESYLEVGSANFTSAWHHEGNVTLSGSQSSCEIMRLPCPMNPENTAEELMTMVGTVAYVETIHGCGPQSCVTTTIVLINDNLYCVYPKTNIPTYSVCPHLIG